MKPSSPANPHPRSSARTGQDPAEAPRRSRLEIAGLWLWALLALGIAIRIGLVEADPRRNNVYLKVFAQAGEAFARGESLYLLPDGLTTGFRYPPLSAAIFTPFALCGPVLGSLLWRAVNFGVLLLGIRACFRAGFPVPLGSAARGGFLAVVALLGITSLNNGQTNPLILGLFLLGTIGTLKGRACGPAAAVAGGVVLKLYPMAYGWVLGALRPRQFLWLALFTALAAVLPFVLQDPDYIAAQYRELQGLLAVEDRRHDGLWNRYRDLRLVADSVGLTLSDTLFLGLGVGGGAAIVGLCFWLRRLGAEPKLVLDYAFSLTMCWFMLLGPATEKATYILVAPSVAWPLMAIWQDRRRQPVMFWALLVANLLLLSSLFPIDLSRTSSQTWRWCLLPYGVLILAGTIAVRAVGDLRRLGPGDRAREVAA